MNSQLIPQHLAWGWPSLLYQAVSPLLVLSRLALRALRPHLFHCACSASSSLCVLSHRGRQWGPHRSGRARRRAGMGPGVGRSGTGRACDQDIRTGTYVARARRPRWDAARNTTSDHPSERSHTHARGGGAHVTSHSRHECKVRMQREHAHRYYHTYPDTVGERREREETGDRDAPMGATRGERG